MKKISEFNLTISPRYVPHWTKWEAFRELMQNVIDRKNEFEAAEIIFKYNPQKQRITIGNKLTILKKNTLILGETSKADNADAIGKYGEGYKLAMLVLLRMGIRIRIRTGSEIWAPSIKYSPEFETDLLAITVMDSPPTDNLLFELDGITSEDYSLFKKNCLFLDPPQSKISTTYGDILLEDEYRSRLFVEGLFVCDFNEKDKIRYGYNMRAPYLSLDRDRQKVGTFNLLWEVGRIYASLDSTYANLIYALENEHYNDVMYYRSHISNQSNALYKALCSLHYNDFVAKYGKNVLPVKSNEEANFVREKYNNLNPVILETVRYEYITSSDAYIASRKAKVPTEETPYTIIKKIVMKYLIGKDHKELRDKIIAELLPLARSWKMRG